MILVVALLFVLFVVVALDDDDDDDEVEFVDDKWAGRGDDGGLGLFVEIGVSSARDRLDRSFGTGIDVDDIVDDEGVVE